MPALLGFAWAAFSAGRLGTTDAIVYQAGKEISSSDTSDVKPAGVTFDWIRGDLEQAADQDAQNPSIHEMLGRLALLRSRDDSASDSAIESFTLALQQRPTSPYSWASLVEALYRKGDTGPRFEQTLRRAAETGPWEPEVQRTVADYGLAVWSEVSASSRTVIDRIVANGMVRNAPEILQISLRRDRLGVACAHLDLSMRTDPKWARICRGAEAT